MSTTLNNDVIFGGNEVESTTLEDGLAIQSKELDPLSLPPIRKKKALSPEPEPKGLDKDVVDFIFAEYGRDPNATFESAEFKRPEFYRTENVTIIYPPESDKKNLK